MEGKILGVEKNNFFIYIVGLAICILLLVLSFFINILSHLFSICCGVCASGIGAILLAYFIEKINLKRRDQFNKKIREDKFTIIKEYMFIMLNSCVQQFMSYKQTKH